MSWYLFWVYVMRWNRYKKKRNKRKAKKRAKDIELKSRDVPDGRIMEEDEDFENADVEKNVVKLGEEGCDNDNDIDNDSDVDDDDDLLVLKRPKAYLLLSIWSYFEILLLFIIVFSTIGKNNFPQNFLSDLCSSGCKKTVLTSICYKIATSLLMAIGARTVSHIKKVLTDRY